MNCEMFAQMLDNYADLTDEDMQELESHAEICEKCNADMAFMRSILGTVKSLPPIDPPSDFLESVNARLDREIAKESVIRRFARRSKPYVYRYGAIAACAVLAVGVGMNADMLLSKMNNDSSGVITEERITDVSDDVNDESAHNWEATEPESLSGTSLPEARKEETVKQTSLPLQTPKSFSSNTAPPSSSGSVSTPIPKASSGNRANTNANAPSDRASASENKDLTVTSPAPQPSAAEKTTIDPAPVTNTHEQPASRALTGEKIPVYTREPENLTEPTPAVETISGRIASRAAEPAPYSINERAISVPDEYSLLTATENPENENFDAFDYSIAYNEMDNQKSDVTSYAPLSSMVSVKSKDAARVQELVDVFVSGVYGNYYMITAVDMRNLLGQFDREGIWYSASIMESGDSVSFRIVTVPSD